MGFELVAGSFAALIFDCDGTLVETLPAHVAALQAVLQPFGLEPTMEWARSKYGQTPSVVLDAVSREIGPIPAAKGDVLRAWGEGYGRHLDLLQEIKPVCDVARAWRGRVPMSVASNGRRGSVLATLDAVGLRDLFGAVVSIDDVEHGKPAPDLFLEAARLMGVAAGDCVVFEDSPEGMEAAQRAGMRAVYTPGLVADSLRG